ncbi:MAG: EamA family transporter [Candidatus Bathyarchaeota archaeon]|jgi:transporter family protein|nr:MAG: EamA family transporter [Candidatus Bathyarchaeota archaeon]
MEWFFLAALSAFFAALVAVFAKIGLQGIDSNVAAAVRAIIMAAFIVAFVISTGKGDKMLQFSSQDMGWITLSGIAGALSWLFYFAALKLAEASRVAMIDRASILIVIVLSALFLGEKITLKTSVAGILIFTGLLLLTVKLG